MRVADEELEELAGERRAAYRRLGEEVAEERPVACARGCGTCCEMKPLIDLVDGLVLHLGLRRRLLWTAELQNVLVGAELRDLGTTFVEHAVRGFRCVFLDDEGACSVHAWRPVCCGAVFGSAVGSLCLPRLASPSAMRPIMRGVLDAHRRWGLPRRLYTVAGAVLDAAAWQERQPERARFYVEVHEGAAEPTTEDVLHAFDARAQRGHRWAN